MLTKIIEQCNSALSMGNLDLAIKLLLDGKIKNKKLKKKIILLSGRFQRIKAEQQAGTISRAEAEIQFAKIAKDLLDILENIESLYLQNHNE